MVSDGHKVGGLIVEPGWFQLWPPNELDQFNLDYKVEEYLPGFLGFGSNGGGELLAFGEGGKIFMIPFIGMSSDDAKLVAGSWVEFVSLIERRAE